ncbi:MAG: hypothetical protein NTY62_04605 [Euryarchaeota archaeon]|nr:hypothetical protein [Euryarchaeota archaeon]
MVPAVVRASRDSFLIGSGLNGHIGILQIIIIGVLTRRTVKSCYAESA